MVQRLLQANRPLFFHFHDGIHGIAILKQNLGLQNDVSLIDAICHSLEVKL